jgi:hypothetical protein
MSFAVFLPFLCSVSLSAAMPGLRYLGEVGHLDTPDDPRTSIRFGRTRVVSTGNGQVRFEGSSDSGKRWHASLPVQGGIGWTAVWQADFDHNGRPDLLIASHFPGNGRCIDEITLSFLLFSDRGQPIPWVIQTRMPVGKGFKRIPAIFVDLNHDGRAELIVTDCTYSEPPRSGENRRIMGIYEAKDAKWGSVHPARIAPYTALLHQSHRFRTHHDQLLPTDPNQWPDHGNEVKAYGSDPVKLADVLPASATCRGVRLPPVVDGVLQTAGWKDPCEELGKDRIQLSNGTVCDGWPTVVLDRPGGREIAAEAEPVKALLHEIIDQQLSVVMTGRTDLKRCSPTVIWASTGPE